MSMANPFSYTEDLDPFGQRARQSSMGARPRTSVNTQPVPSGAYTPPQPPSSPSASQSRDPTANWPTMITPPVTGGITGYDPTTNTYPNGTSSPAGPGTIPIPSPWTLPSNANTDGYTPPAWMPSAPGGVMPGWDATKWSDPSHLTPKYVAGRIESQYAPRVENVAKVIADLQRAYGPQVRQVGDDSAFIPGQGIIDLLQGAGLGGKAWQWLVPGTEGGTRAPTQSQPTQIDPTIANMMALLAQPAPSAQAPAAGGVDQTALLQSILQMLQTYQQQQGALMQQIQNRPQGPSFTYY